WLMFVLLALVIYSFTFTVFANLIGSPFYGIIAERVIALERGLTDKTPTSTRALLATAWGSFRRELQIIAYMLPRTLGIALLTVMISFVPIINIFAPLIAASWAAWSLALQYMDYPGDSDELSFTQVRQRAGKQRLLSLSFGLSALVAAAIPLVNLLLLPATVVGGTLLWCREYSEI
ncbi:MAG: sulfate transporter CysZ, partial [Porticoccaceae bacterium]|nr:sulfate transporter CysZ [Porticoccaceae bacterium]